MGDVAALRAELGRLFRIESERVPFCAQCGLPQDDGTRDRPACQMGHDAIGEPHPDRGACRALALYYSAATPEEIGELLRLRGMHGFADHVELLCRASGPMHTALRQMADNLASGKMLGGAWMLGPWPSEYAVRALRWAADRIEAHPVKPVGWDDSALPREAQRPSRWQGKRSVNRRLT